MPKIINHLSKYRIDVRSFRVAFDKLKEKCG